MEEVAACQELDSHDVQLGSPVSELDSPVYPGIESERDKKRKRVSEFNKQKRG